MRDRILINHFQGIAPRFEPNLKPGFAQTAQNIDLSTGKIKPIKNAELQESGGTSYDPTSLFYYNSAWYTGVNNASHYLEWKIGSNDLLIYLEDGTLKKRIGSVTADLGQDAPDAPTTAVITGTAFTVASYTFTANATTDELTLSPGHVYVTGDGPVRVSSDDTLPSGLAADTDYWVIDVNATKIKLAASEADAIAGMEVDMTDTGTGTHSLWGVILVSASPHGFSTGDGPVRVITDDTLPTELVVDTDYWVINVFSSTFKLATSLANANAGTDVDITSEGVGTHNLLADGNVDGAETQYFITTTRDIGGHTDESGPSSLSTALDCSYTQVRITAPAITDTDVTHWSIYRISTAGTYLLVTTLVVATTTYDDNLSEANLGVACPTYYTSDRGNDIEWAKPITTIDGLVNEVVFGMLFAWDGPTLYWSDPGYPDAWPSYFYINFPSNIKRVFSLGGSVTVLCETGPWKVDGSHPELLQPSDPLGDEPCISTAACKTSRGIVYLSDSGLTIFNLIDTLVLSDSNFTETWFRDNITSSGAFLAENDGIGYLFHSGGVLKVDYRVNPAIWTTLDLIADAAWRYPSDGELYYLDSTGIQKLNGGSDDQTWTWKSGDLVGKTPEDKEWDFVEAIGSGTVTITLYVDDVQKATKSLDFASIRGRSLKLPEETYGRALQVQISGTGTIKELEVWYSWM